MKVFSWNVNGWTPTVNNIIFKHGSLKEFFDYHGADVVCIQEAKIPQHKLTKEIACVEGYESFWSICKTKKGYSGVATYVKLDYAVIHAELDLLGGGEQDIDQEGRCVLTDHGEWVLMNVYVPNAGHGPERSRIDFKLKFLNALYASMTTQLAKGKQVILVGDLNVCISPKDVHKEKKWEDMYSIQELEIAKRIFCEFTDVWRMQHSEEENVYTVWDERKNHRPLNIGQRIDFILCSKDLVSSVQASEVILTPPKWSDHAAVAAVFYGLQGKTVDQPHVLSSRSIPKFNDKSQRSILSMLGKRKQKEETDQQSDDNQMIGEEKNSGKICVTEEGKEDSCIVNMETNRNVEGLSYNKKQKVQQVLEDSLTQYAQKQFINKSQKLQRRPQDVDSNQKSIKSFFKKRT